jgi:hypothetical protein
MAQLSLGETRWRMVRQVLKKKRFTFTDVRAMSRQDTRHFEWLVENGFFVSVGSDHYEMTAKGRDSADLGFYDWEPALKPKKR